MWQTLRRKFPSFCYQSAKWKITKDVFSAQFEYQLGKYHFSHQIEFETTTPTIADSNLEKINQLVFNLGIVEGISYWKLACSPEFCIEAGSVNTEQLEWWRTVIINGMGEYFFVNDIDFTSPDFLVVSTSDQQTQGSVKDYTSFIKNSDIPYFSESDSSILIPVGGGKDSILTVELLKKKYGLESGKKLGILLINPTQAAQDVATVSGLADIYIVHRKFDEQLRELNQKGFLNGHVPVSASFAFISTLVSQMFGYDFTAISNERSSNEGNITFHGREINHQWSKSVYFETMFQNYFSAEYPFYFSFVRPLYELQIARLFATVGKDYFSLFRSCNRGSKQNIWCGQCSKCLFAYIILLPFIGIEKVKDIFGKDLLADESLYEVALELIGQGEKKPLDCVGMFDESAVAFLMCQDVYFSLNEQLPALLQKLSSHLSADTSKTLTTEFFQGWNSSHRVPNELITLLNYTG